MAPISAGTNEKLTDIRREWVLVESNRRKSVEWRAPCSTLQGVSLIICSSSCRLGSYFVFFCLYSSWFQKIWAILLELDHGFSIPFQTDNAFFPLLAGPRRFGVPDFYGFHFYRLIDDGGGRPRSSHEIHSFLLTLSRSAYTWNARDAQTKTYVFNCILTLASTRQKFDSFTLKENSDQEQYGA